MLKGICQREQAIEADGSFFSRSSGSSPCVLKSLLLILLVDTRVTKHLDFLPRQAGNMEQTVRQVGDLVLSHAYVFSKSIKKTV